MEKQIIYTKILHKTKTALDELGIPFFISSGTCLGYFREDKFLDHDYDIDIGIFHDDYNPKIVEKMEEQGLKLYRVLGDVENGLELSFRLEGTRLKKKAKVDLFLHYEDLNENLEPKEGIYWVSYQAPKFKKRIKYRVSKFDLKKVLFMDIPVFVPYPTIKYIKEHYGEDWYKPILTKGLGGEYDYRTSPKSIVENFLSKLKK